MCSHEIGHGGPAFKDVARIELEVINHPCGFEGIRERLDLSMKCFRKGVTWEIAGISR
jgi:hypothetical protein